MQVGVQNLGGSQRKQTGAQEGKKELKKVGRSQRRQVIVQGGPKGWVDININILTRLPDSGSNTLKIKINKSL